MKKEFNVTGACFPHKHYMVDISGKIAEIIELVKRGKYFVINRPRQYGKTTTLNMLTSFLNTQDEYLPINISFEGIGSEGFQNANAFSKVFYRQLRNVLIYGKDKQLADFFKTAPSLDFMDELGDWITEWVSLSGKKVVLLIDEVDKSSNNQLFLDFLGMLRNKYLQRYNPGQFTFYSIILAGVHDIKTLKLQIRTQSETKYNSPWNIAVDFTIKLDFSPDEIQTMLKEYALDQQVTMDIPLIAKKLFYFTSGYPFLVSYLCKVVYEELLPAKTNREWIAEDLDKAFQMTLQHSNTNFDSLIQNLENNKKLYDFIFKIVMDGVDFLYNPHDPLIYMGRLYGILSEIQGKVHVHNLIYDQIIYNYMTSKQASAGSVTSASPTAHYLDNEGNLDIRKVFAKFQVFMKENYSRKDQVFWERNGRLLFLAFLRPIINGRGFDFKEVQIAEEKRLDVVVTFDRKKYIIELKIWRGPTYHQEGLQQLSQYLERQQVDTGYLLIFDTRKEYAQSEKWETVTIQGKTIISAWV